MASSFEVHPIRNGDRLTFRVSGELDYLTASVLRRDVVDGMRDPSVSGVDLDLSRLGFCDSTGLGALIEIRTNASQRDVPLMLLGPGVALLRLLEMTGLDAYFSFAAVPAEPEVSAGSDEPPLLRS